MHRRHGIVTEITVIPFNIVSALHNLCQHTTLDDVVFGCLSTRNPSSVVQRLMDPNFKI